MRKSRWLLLGLLIAGSVCAVVVVLTLMMRSPLTKENFDRIQVGMTRTEVEAVFGEPPTSLLFENYSLWESADGYQIMTVEFGEDGRVLRTGWSDFPDDRTALQKALDSLPLRQLWIKDEPSHLTPYRIHGGVGPASSSI
jgi:hypothetical protein